MTSAKTVARLIGLGLLVHLIGGLTLPYILLNAALVISRHPARSISRVLLHAAKPERSPPYHQVIESSLTFHF